MTMWAAFNATGTLEHIVLPCLWPMSKQSGDSRCLIWVQTRSQLWTHATYRYKCWASWPLGFKCPRYRQHMASDNADMACADSWILS